MKPNIHVELTSTPKEKKPNIKNICKKATQPNHFFPNMSICVCVWIYMKENYNFKTLDFVFGFIFMLEFHMLDLQLS